MEHENENSSLSGIKGITHPPVKVFQAQTNPDPAKIDSSTERQKDAITYLIESHLNKLSVRSSSALKNHPGLNLFDDYDISNGLPIFKLIKGLVENDILLNEQEKIIFFNEFCTPQSFKAKTLNQIGIDLGLTRERVRQIKAQFLYKFDNTFSFIQRTEIKSLVNYGFDLNGSYLEITDDLISQISTSEGTSFNRLFITKIIALLYSDKYDLFGQVNLKNPDQRKVSSNWKRSYIVNKNLSAILDFNSFINDVRIRLSGKIYEDYRLNFLSYLLDFRKTSNTESLDLIAQTAEYILLNEFELCLNSDECIVFSKNTKKPIINFVREALEESNKPLTVIELGDLIEKKYPGTIITSEALRGSCQRDPNLIFFGKTGTYGLKVWENDSDVKGGTIRSIVEEFLRSDDNPKHINEITEYVNKFRNTNPGSIMTNLKRDSSGTFVFFNQSFVGLAEKKYNKEYLPYENIPKFLGKAIISMVVRKGGVDFEDLVNYFSSRISISGSHVEIIIRHLIEVHHLQLNDSLITAANED